MIEHALDVSVLIASYNNKRTLIPCLQHLSDQTFTASRFEVVVILDGSTDGSNEALQDLQRPFQLSVINKNNEGKAIALNEGARIARGKYFIVIDSDILTNPEFIESHFNSLQEADVVIGPIPLSELSPVSFMTDGVKEWADQHCCDIAQKTNNFTCMDIFGANLSISKSAFEEIGGYRTDLRRTQDLHIGKKIINGGLKVAFCKTAIAAQIFDKTVPDLYDNLYYDGKSHYLFIQEYPEEKINFKLGHYLPQTLSKRMLRPLIMRNRLLGNLIVTFSRIVLEWCRSQGLQWAVLGDIKGLIGDCIYWQGVYEEINDRKKFTEFIRSST